MGTAESRSCRPPADPSHPNPHTDPDPTPTNQRPSPLSRNPVNARPPDKPSASPTTARTSSNARAATVAWDGPARRDFSLTPPPAIAIGPPTFTVPIARCPRGVCGGRRRGRRKRSDERNRIDEKPVVFFYPLNYLYRRQTVIYLQRI